MVTMSYIKGFTSNFLITLNKSLTNLPTVTFHPLIGHEIVRYLYLMTFFVSFISLKLNF